MTRTEAETAPLRHIRTPSPIGELQLAASTRGLAQIAFRPEDLEGLSQPLTPELTEGPSAQEEHLRKAELQLAEYFAGERTFFALSYDLFPYFLTPESPGHTPRRVRNPWVPARGTFRVQAQVALQLIPYGQVWTYQELAQTLGNPGAARAVGTACATNPLPIVLPCHRVVPTGGAIGQYGGGTPVKEWLLALEDARLSA